MIRSLVGALGLACLTACGASSAAPSSGAKPKVEVAIEHSAFALDRTEFEVGDTITFVIRNDDPIDHEFIIGGAKVHAQHEEGKQRHHHGAVPGEISVPAGTTRRTTFTFSDDGSVEYACHLPGHYDYGMRGAVSVE